MAAAAGLLVVCLVLVWLLFDPNDYRVELQNQFRQQTGRELRIAGDLKLSVWPWLAVRAGTLTIGNAPGFGDQPFFSVDETRVGVRLLPLLSREFEIGKVTLRHPRLHLVVDGSGADNWSDLLASRDGEATPPAGETAPPAVAAAGAFSLAGVEIVDGVLEYEDRRKKSHWQIQEIDLDAGRFAPGRPVPIGLSFRPPGPGTTEIRFQVGKALLDTANRRLELPGWKLDAGDNHVAGDLVVNLGEKDTALDGSARASRLLVGGIEMRDVDARFGLQQKKFRLSPLKLRAFDGESVTTLTYDMSPSVPTLSIDQRLTDVDTGVLLSSLIDVGELQGRGNLQATLTGRGADRPALIASLKGPFDLSVKDGELRGADLWHEIERAAAALEGRPLPAPPPSASTRFHRLDARGRVERSTLRNERFEFVAPFLTVRGKGDVDYRNGRVNMALKAKLLKVPQTGKGNSTLASLVGIDIPVTVTGPLSDPNVKPDVAYVLQKLAQERLKKEGEKAGRKLKDKVSSAWDRLLGR